MSLFCFLIKFLSDNRYHFDISSLSSSPFFFQLVKLFATVVLIFALCYLPIHVFNLIQDFRKEVLYFEYIKLVYLTCLLIAMSNCFVNPIIYCWMNTKFRNGFRQVFSFLPCVSTNPDWRGKRGISGREFVQTQMESVSYKSERTKSSSENNYSYITLQVVNNNHASGKGGPSGSIS